MTTVDQFIMKKWSNRECDVTPLGLFEQKYTVVLDNLFEKKEIKKRKRRTKAKSKRISKFSQFFTTMINEHDITIDEYPAY